MVITVEPMLNLGTPSVRVLNDQWTVESADGSLSAQWEHMVLVTRNGYEVLTLRPGEDYRHATVYAFGASVGRPSGPW